MEYIHIIDVELSRFHWHEAAIGVVEEETGYPVVAEITLDLTRGARRFHGLSVGHGWRECVAADDGMDMLRNRTRADDGIFAPNNDGVSESNDSERTGVLWYDWSHERCKHYGYHALFEEIHLDKNA